MGRAMKNLDKLLAMPYGCGEQNMVLFAPNIFILNYLKSTGQLTPDIQEKATLFLESGECRTPSLNVRRSLGPCVCDLFVCPSNLHPHGGSPRVSAGTHLQTQRWILQRLRKERRVREHLVGKNVP